MKNFCLEVNEIRVERHYPAQKEDQTMIVVNKIRCNKCGDIIESVSDHDFEFCKCGAVAVDGGHDYLRRCGNREDWEELSVIEE